MVQGSHSPLSHFTAVLGIDIKNERFREPGNYTSMLAGLIWVGRLLMLEYALLKYLEGSMECRTRRVIFVCHDL